MPQVRIEDIVKGHYVKARGESEWGIVVRRSKGGFLVEYDAGDGYADQYDVPDDEIVAHAPDDPNKVGVVTTAPRSIRVGDIVEDSQGKVYKVTGWGRKRAQILDQQGKTWTITPGALVHSTKSFKEPKQGAVLLLGSVVTCADAARRWGYPPKTEFVVIKVGSGSVNIVRLGGDINNKFAYYRCPDTSVKVVK